jgi:polyisoprenoid-binding protein YceI
MATETSTTHWSVDPSHSEIGFRIRHLMITNVKGFFSEYTATAQTRGDNWLSATIDVRIKPNSINTNDTNRDNHLRSADFFDVENHGDIHFASTSVEKNDEEHYTIHGNLTIKGITKSIVLKAEISDVAKDPWGNLKVGAIVTGKINRKDWGLNWNATLETGGFLVADDIKIDCEVQLVKQAATA